MIGDTPRPPWRRVCFLVGKYVDDLPPEQRRGHRKGSYIERAVLECNHEVSVNADQRESKKRRCPQCLFESERPTGSTPST